MPGYNNTGRKRDHCQQQYPRTKGFDALAIAPYQCRAETSEAHEERSDSADECSKGVPVF